MCINMYFRRTESLHSTPRQYDPADIGFRPANAEIGVDDLHGPRNAKQCADFRVKHRECPSTV